MDNENNVEIRRQLNSLGINHGSIYPDLQHQCEAIEKDLLRV